MTETQPEKSTKTSVGTEEERAREAFNRFLEYDFHADTTFMAGWSEIMASFGPNIAHEQVFNGFTSAKIFYFIRMMSLPKELLQSLHVLYSEHYSKNSEEIRKLDCYANLLKDVNENADHFKEAPVVDNDVRDSENSTAAGEISTLDDDGDPDNAVCDQSTREHIQPDEKYGETVNTDAPPYPTTFEQIIESIRKGEELPGLDRIVVEPTNEPITDSAVVAPKKPWEK